MKKFAVELVMGFIANVEVEAEDSAEAIQKAKKLVYENPNNYCDTVEVEDISFVGEIGK